VWFVGRYLDVKNCLADPETFSAHRGVGLAYQFNRLAEGTGILSTEGPQHQLLRRILMRDLNTRRLRSVQTQVHAQAHNLVGGLVRMATLTRSRTWRGCSLSVWSARSSAYRPKTGN
jgi:cytochrome P450